MTPGFQTIKVRELAAFLDCPFEGDGEVNITGVASLEGAGPGDLVFLANPRLRPHLDASRAAAVIASPAEAGLQVPVIRAADPHLAFIRAVEHLNPPGRPALGVHPLAFVAPTAKVGPGASVGPLSYIGEGVEVGARTVIHALAALYPGVRVGEDCVIHSHVAIREGTIIGRRVVIHNGVVIGADGFGYIRGEDGRHIKIPQVGGVTIEDDVEIGANTCVDRATLEATVVRRGAKIDDLVMVAHNVEVGENAVLVGQAGVAGSSKIGRNVILSGQAGVADHLTIGDDSIVAAKSGVTKSLAPKSFVSGSPHLDARTWRRVWAVIPELPELVKELRRLRERVAELEKKLG
jgi:UDP-3-O-[3-hydroxymyristoyl] glucosamine N-acyltransferase